MADEYIDESLIPSRLTQSYVQERLNDLESTREWIKETNRGPPRLAMETPMTI